MVEALELPVAPLTSAPSSLTMVSVAAVNLSLV